MRSLLITAAVCLALMLGFLLGTLFSRLPQNIPITIREDRRPGIPVVQIDGVRDGQLTGSMRGDVRVFLGDRQVLAGSGGIFHVPAGTLLTNTVTIRVPQGMQYVASRRGKKYYRVDSPAGEKLAPENRIYFVTAEEAERAGYVRGF